MMSNNVCVSTYIFGEVKNNARTHTHAHTHTHTDRQKVKERERGKINSSKKRKGREFIKIKKQYKKPRVWREGGAEREKKRGKKRKGPTNES